MKYAFMTFSTPELSLDDVVAAATQYGYDGVEPRLDAGHGHGVEVAASATKREAIKRTFAESGIVAACLATSCRYADPETHEAMVADTRERIDLAADVGCSRLRVFGGAFPDSVTREQATELLAKGLSSAADHAGERGVTLCLETHDSWCDPTHVAEVLRRVDHPAVGANWDAMHPVRTGLATIDESFELLEPWIRHLHVHDGGDDDGKHVLAPMGEGVIDHRRVIELLAGTDFDGYLSGEWINWEPYEMHLPRELAVLKSYES